MRFTRGGDGVPVERAVGIVKPPPGTIDKRSCHACLSYDYAREQFVVGGTELVVLCLDATECCNRYRRGVSAASYAAALRGELLGVAP